MEGNGKGALLFLIGAAIVLFLSGYFLFFTDHSPKESDKKVQSYTNKQPALTLKEDKANANAMEEKKEKEKQDNNSNNKDDEEKKDDKKSKKELKQSAKDNALQTLKILDKPKDEYNKDSTQTLFESVATKDFVKNHSSNNKDDKVVTYKNVSIDINDKELEKSKAKGSLKFDKLTKPKGKDSSVKPSTEIDYRVEVIFKKEGDSFKVYSIQS